MKKRLFLFFFLFLEFFFCKSQIPTVGLSGYWPFSGYQLANDFSGNGNNGAVHGATLTFDRFGNCGQAYKFNGINNFIEVPSSPTVDMNNTDFTIAVWEKTYLSDTIGPILQKHIHTGAWEGYAIITNDKDPGYCPIYKHAYFYVASGMHEEVCTDNPIGLDTTWHLLTGVYRKATNQTYLYVDGLLQSTVGQASGSTSSTMDLIFGGGGGVFFTGVLDAIRIYQRALSSSEITQLFNEPNPGSGCNSVLCSSLGAPVYVNDFGSNTALYAPALPAGETNYPYVTGTPINGSYVISYTSNPSGTVPPLGDYIHAGDHTGNPHGCMMIVNADYPPDTVFTINITGLCPNTAYAFSAFVANNDNPTGLGPVCSVSNYIYANVRFQIEYPPGTLQGSVNSGNLPLGTNDSNLTWIQTGFMFTTASGQSATKIVLINNAPGGCGNDFVVDDISITPCGSGNLLSISGNTVICSGATTTLTASGAGSYTWNTGSTNASVIVSPTVTTTYTVESSGGVGSCSSANSIAVATVSVVPNLPVSITGDSIICIGQTTTLTANGASNYIWSANAGSATNASVVLSPTVTTIFSVVGEAGTCIGQAIKTVFVSPPPLVSVTGNTLVCIGGSTTLTATGATQYIWSTGANTAAIIVNPGVNTNYAVLGTTGSCAAQAGVIVSVNAQSDFSMPNIVTPNNDHINDYIDFSKYAFTSMQLEIYNRWGLKIFESNNTSCIWNPIADDGIYFYIIQYSVNCYKELQTNTLKGFITILR